MKNTIFHSPKNHVEHLIKKADGNIITKKRCEIPDGNGYTIELDIFEGAFNGTVIAEVEFNTIEEADQLHYARVFYRRCN